jgi:hypothetical protein
MAAAARLGGEIGRRGTTVVKRVVWVLAALALAITPAVATAGASGAAAGPCIGSRPPCA